MISILMPLYNGVEFLDDSVPSVINQTYKNWELLVGINGHSTESAYTIINKIRSFRDNRIKIIICTKTTKSKTNTLNTLVNHAKYKHICLLDVDDTWEPTKLEQQILVADKYDVIGTDVEYIGDKSGSPNLFLGKISAQMFSWQNPIINSAVMMKKSDAYWEDEWEGLDDFHLWIHLLNKNKTFYNVPQVLAHHRIHGKSFFNNKNDEMSRKLKEKIPPLTESEMVHLIDIIDNKKWEI